MTGAFGLVSALILLCVARAQPAINRAVCSQGCPKGYRCEYKRSPCNGGQFCHAELIPICVPQTDACGGCPKGKVCTSNGILCFRERCPRTHKCGPVSAARPLAACKLACNQGYECQLQNTACPWWQWRVCRTRPVPKCVPK